MHHQWRFSKITESEKRLCHKVGYDTFEPDIPDSVNIDETAQGQMLVMRSGYRSLKDIMHKMQDMGSTLEGGKLPAHAYLQIVTENRWVKQFKDPDAFVDPMVPGPISFVAPQNAKVVEQVWLRLSLKQRALFAAQYFAEHMPYMVDDSDNDNPITILKKSPNAALRRKALDQLLAIREYQRGVDFKDPTTNEVDIRGHNFDPVVYKIKIDDTKGYLEKTRDSLRMRYLKGDVLRDAMRVRAWNDFFEAVDPTPEAKGAVMAVINYNDAELEAVREALPRSAIKGALKLGILTDDHLRVLIEKYHERNAPRHRTLRLGQQRRAALRTQLDARGQSEIAKGYAQAPEKADDGPKDLSDRAWGAYGSMEGAPKFVVGVTAAAMGLWALSRMFRDRPNDANTTQKLFGLGKDGIALAGLGLGAYVLGGHKVVDAAMGANAPAAAPVPFEGSSIDLAKEENMRSYVNYFERHLKEHNDDVAVHQFKAAHALGQLPLSIVATSFNTWNAGRQGEYFATPDIQTALQIQYGAGAQEIIDDIHENEHQWGDPMAHICYLYAMHKAPNRRFYQHQHNRLDNYLNDQGVVLSRHDPLDFVNNFDAIRDPTLRQQYENAVNAGATAMINNQESQTLGDFIITINSMPKIPDLPPEPPPKEEETPPPPPPTEGEDTPPPPPPTEGEDTPPPPPPTIGITTIVPPPDEDKGKGKPPPVTKIPGIVPPPDEDKGKGKPPPITALRRTPPPEEEDDSGHKLPPVVGERKPPPEEGGPVVVFPPEEGGDGLPPPDEEGGFVEILPPEEGFGDRTLPPDEVAEGPTPPPDEGSDADTPPPDEGSDADTPPPDEGSDADTPPPDEGSDADTPPPDEGSDADTPPPDEGSDADTPPPDEGSDADTPPPDEGSDADTPPPDEGSDADTPPPEESTDHASPPPPEGSDSDALSPKEGASTAVPPPPEGSDSDALPPKEGASTAAPPPPEGSDSDTPPPRESTDNALGSPREGVDSNIPPPKEDREIVDPPTEEESSNQSLPPETFDTRELTDTQRREQMDRTAYNSLMEIFDVRLAPDASNDEIARAIAAKLENNPRGLHFDKKGALAYDDHWVRPIKSSENFGRALRTDPVHAMRLIDASMRKGTEWPSQMYRVVETYIGTQHYRPLLDSERSIGVTEELASQLGTPDSGGVYQVVGDSGRPTYLKYSGREWKWSNDGSKWISGSKRNNGMFGGSMDDYVFELVGQLS